MKKAWSTWLRERLQGHFYQLHGAVFDRECDRGRKVSSEKAEMNIFK